MAGASGVAFAKAICSARIVLPVPGAPIITLMVFMGIPPCSTSSSPSDPVGIFSTITHPLQLSASACREAFAMSRSTNLRGGVFREMHRPQLLMLDLQHGGG